MLGAANHGATELLDHTGRILLERMSESVINGDEIPRLTAIFDHTGRSTNRQRVRVIAVVNAVFGTSFTSQIAGGRTRVHGDDLLFRGQLLHGQPDGRVGQVSNHIDVLLVDPFAGSR